MEGGGWVETVNSDRHCCWFSDKYDNEWEREDQLRLWRVFQQARHLPGKYFFFIFSDQTNENSNLCSESQAFSTSSDQRPWDYMKIVQILRHAYQMPIIEKYQCQARQINISIGNECLTPGWGGNALWNCRTLAQLPGDQNLHDHLHHHHDAGHILYDEYDHLLKR